MHRPERSPAGRSRPSTAATTSSTEASLPGPVHPQARYPSPGATTCAPRARNASRFPATAGCSYMFVFMAGAMTTGARVTR